MAFSGSDKMSPTRRALAALGEGNVEEYNRFRDENPDWRPNFAAVDLKHKDLRGGNFTNGYDLKKNAFAGSNLEGAIMPDGFDFKIGELKLRKAWAYAVLVACLPVWYFILTTPDAAMFMDGFTKASYFRGCAVFLFVFLPLGLVSITADLNQFRTLPAVFPDGSLLKDHVPIWANYDERSKKIPVTPKLNGLLVISYVFPVLTLLMAWLQFLPTSRIELVFRLPIYITVFIVLFIKHISTRWVVLPIVLVIGLFPSAYWAVKFVNLESRQRNTFLDADMRGADLKKMTLWNKDLRWADMREADLSGAALDSVDFYRAHLDKANMVSANLKYGSFEQATLSGADMTATTLNWASFQDAVMFGTQLEAAWFFDVDLTEAIGLTPEQLKEACIFANTLLPDDEPIWSALSNGTINPLPTPI